MRSVRSKVHAVVGMQRIGDCNLCNEQPCLWKPPLSLNMALQQQAAKE